MNRAHDCKHLREQLFDYRRAELSALDAAQFEEEVAACPDCAARTGRLIGLLDLAAEAPADVWLDTPAEDAAGDPLGDALFASISQRLLAVQGADVSSVESKPSPDISPAESREVRLHGPLAELGAAANDDDDEVAPRRSFVPWLVAAACAALALGAAYKLGGAGEVAAPQEPAQIAAKADAKPADLGALAAASSAPDAVKVFASEGATWTLEREAQGYVVRLSGGTLLIEFLPGAGESLRVETPDSQVEVVGTVFFVRAKVAQAQEAVGVLAGSVRVKRAGEQAGRLLKRGQGIEADGDVRELEPVTFEQVRPHVDLEAHDAALRARADSAAPVKAQQGAPAELVKPPEPAVIPDQPIKQAPAPRVETIAQLRQRATDALAARQYAQAAQDYERILQRTGAASPEAATLRLELARLYMRELNQREPALNHLRAFLKDHPGDVAAPSARRQLCRLVGPEDPQCQP